MVGERISVQGLSGPLDKDYLKPLNQSKHIKKFLSSLKTNQACEACFGGWRLESSAGRLKVESLKDCEIS